MPDAPHTDRRSFLAALAGVVAGCGGARRGDADASTPPDAEPDSPTDAPTPTPTPTPTSTPTASATATADRTPTPAAGPTVVPETYTPTPAPTRLRPGQWYSDRQFGFSVLNTTAKEGYLFVLITVKYLGGHESVATVSSAYGFALVSGTDIVAPLLPSGHWRIDPPEPPRDIPYPDVFRRGEPVNIYRVAELPSDPSRVDGVALAVVGLGIEAIWRGGGIDGR